MAISNHERVGKALDLLKVGLLPFVEREMASVYGKTWLEAAQAGLKDDRQQALKQKGGPHWDTQALLAVIWEQWNQVFNKKLGYSDRTLVSELRTTRNDWAHQRPFSTDDAYRALDSIARLLNAIGAEEATEIDRQKQELLRMRFEEQTRREIQKTSFAPIEGKPTGNLRPWRELVTPHPDVASNRYQQAEFAADLAQVHRNEGSDEYKVPKEFFSRTFITEGLKRLLSNALLRLAGVGGDPIVELQTNFGGGKTHSMLALYHLFSGAAFTDLAGIDTVVTAAGGVKPATAKRAVLVGTALGAAKPRKKPDGTIVRTLWGELAWQLLEKKGYKLVAESDEHSVSPGSDELRKLFMEAGPSLILIDELVVYIRQLYDVSDLPAGSFDANLSFVQSLTEAVKAVPNVLLVASIPASDIETGGSAGQEAVTRLRNILGRVESPWRPASGEESFEIVRRRLFEPIIDPNQCKARDAVARAFVEMYRAQRAEFPSHCSESEYERRMQACYPIHPELFDRLFNDWSSLETFQRTRGVLRLMAGVIHQLWERQDNSLLILPANVPMDAGPVHSELTRYLDDSWVPVIEAEVDGPNSVPLTLDREYPNFGRYSACRRVARTLFLGSAPTLHGANKGLEDKQVKLGCVQPGESPATFGDALRRLSDTTTYYYSNERRYWISNQPTVTRLARDRAAQQNTDSVVEEIVKRLRADRQRGDFAGAHVCPESTNDVHDDKSARIVVLGPEYQHGPKDSESSARKFAEQILQSRGTGARTYRNSIVFLVADRSRLKELEDAVRLYLAWKSVDEDKDKLNLDGFQSKQAETKREEFDDTIKQRIPETYQWLIVPLQNSPNGVLEWQEIRLQGPEALAVRASKKLRDENLLLTSMAGVPLVHELDRIPLWRGDNVSIKQVGEDFAQYLYLPRLKDTDVLHAAVKNGVTSLTWSTDTFAFAEGFDSTKQRYLGLKAGPHADIQVDANSLIVRRDVAIKQFDAEKPKREESPSVSGGIGAEVAQTAAAGAATTGGAAAVASPTVTKPKLPTQFYGSVKLDETRVGRDAGKIAEEVIQHLSGLVGASTEVVLEIKVEVPDGISESVAKAVTENCKTLRFTSHGFDAD